MSGNAAVAPPRGWFAPHDPQPDRFQLHGFVPARRNQSAPEPFSYQSVLLPSDHQGRARGSQLVSGWSCKRSEPPATDEPDEDAQINSNDEDGINIRREYDNMEWKYLAQDSMYWEQLEETFVRL